MGNLLYRLAMLFYSVALRGASIRNPKARKFIEGRKNLFVRLKQDFKTNTAPVAWFHCASLGEFEQGRPVIEAFKSKFPQFRILLTFFSPSGYEIRKNYEHADFVHYLPVDTASNAKEFLQITKPTIAFFIKYEFWFFYFKELKKNDIPVFSVSSIFRKDQVFFKWYGIFFRSILKKVDYYFVQNKKSLALLQSVNIFNALITGDTRFDRVIEICKSPKDIPIAAAFKASQKVMVIGSVWPEDMELLYPLINNTASPLKFIIAPHEISQETISAYEKNIQKKLVRFSQTNETESHAFEVLLIDNVGMLSSLYSYAEFSYIGGAFGNGLHNILEAATFGLPVFFGNKNYRKFQEATDLIKLGGAYAVGDYDELKLIFDDLYADEERRLQAGAICFEYVHEKSGATEKIMQHVEDIINP